MNRIKGVIEKKEVNQTWFGEQPFKSYNLGNGYFQNKQPILQVIHKIAEILIVNVKILLKED